LVLLQEYITMHGPPNVKWGCPNLAPLSCVMLLALRFEIYVYM